MWPNSDRITFQALPLAWAVECWELAYRGKGVGGPAEPQSGRLCLLDFHLRSIANTFEGLIVV